MRKGVAGDAVNGVGGNNDSLVRIQGFTGGRNGLRNLSLTRYGVQLSFHVPYSLMFLGCVGLAQGHKMLRAFYRLHGWPVTARMAGPAG